MHRMPTNRIDRMDTTPRLSHHRLDLPHMSLRAAASTKGLTDLCAGRDAQLHSRGAAGGLARVLEGRQRVLHQAAAQGVARSHTHVVHLAGREVVQRDAHDAAQVRHVVRHHAGAREGGVGRVPHLGTQQKKTTRVRRSCYLATTTETQRGVQQNSTCTRNNTTPG